MVNNTLTAKKASNTTLSAYLTGDAVKNHINNVLGDASTGSRFISSIISAVSANTQLSSCSNASIVSSALLGESLKLSPSPQLGHYYLVPFNGKDGKVAQFQLGYKGYIQLAIRSGQYKKLTVVAVKEGELINFNPFTEDIKVSLIEDFEAREKAKTIGYYAMFELCNGYTKAVYWSKAQMEAHAKRYSKSYNTLWGKDADSFDAMAFKTMLRQLISKWGVMSIDMQTAYTSDMTAEDSNGNRVYVDNVDAEDVVETVVVEEAPEEPKKTTKPKATKAEAENDSIADALFG